MDWDVFISHASEDKEAVARPLAAALQDEGVRVWLDENELLLGDSLRRKIEQGLARSRYGVVILSPAFFSKDWPQQELNGLAAREENGDKVILPIWHDVDKRLVATYSPILADRLAVSTAEGTERVATEISKVLRQQKERLTAEASRPGSAVRLPTPKPEQVGQSPPPITRKKTGWSWTQRKILKDILSSFPRQPFALGLCAILLVLTVVLAIIYRVRAIEYESIVNRTLDAETEDTPQKHKGVEAFIFSDVSPRLYERVKEAHLNPSFVVIFSRLKAALESATAQLNSAPETLTLLHPSNGPKGIYTEANSTANGYLFLPTFLIHSQVFEKSVSLADTKAEVQPFCPTPRTVAEVQIKDPAIVKSVTLGRALADTLQELASASVLSDDSEAQTFFQPRPAQVYLITVDGVNRVFNAASAHPCAEYGRQFPSNTFFPGRPYFWPALNEQNLRKTEVDSTQPIGAVFHVSRPYLDLGGSGVVVTLSRPIEIGGVRAVLCIDLQLDTASENIYSALRQNIVRLGGIPAEIRCTLTSDEKLRPDCPAPENATVEQKALIARLKSALDKSGNEEQAWSAVLGNIYMLSSPTESRLSFSVPISQTFENQTEVFHLLLVDVNLNAYRDRTSLIAFASATSFGLMTVLLAYMWGSNIMQRRELELAFENVAKVMRFSPTPYVRLDSEDKMKDVSFSFCRMLGIPRDAGTLAALRDLTLRSLCANKESEDEYERVQRLRAAGQEVEPYPLDLRWRGGNIVRVRVHGATLPGSEYKGLPETFGIFVEQPAVRAPQTSASVNASP